MDIELFIKAFTSFFVIVGPLDKLTVFISLTSSYTLKERRKIALKSTLMAFFIALFFILFGIEVLKFVGVTIPALRISGGIFLMIIALQMLFSSDMASGYGKDEAEEALKKEDISIFPLAIPLIVGAGTISISILFSAEAGNNISSNLAVIGAMGSVIFITYISLIVVTYMQNFIGKTINNIIIRLSGILLGGLSVQFILDGLKDIGVI
jgi:multiple antibiotic resistance protein